MCGLYYNFKPVRNARTSRQTDATALLTGCKETDANGAQNAVQGVPVARMQASASRTQYAAACLCAVLLYRCVLRYVYQYAARKTRNGVHWGACARFVALFIKHNSTTYLHIAPGHGSNRERVDCTLSDPPIVGGFGVRYVEIKDFPCGSSMVCRKTAKRSMRIVCLVGIKPLHSIGV